MADEKKGTKSKWREWVNTKNAFLLVTGLVIARLALPEIIDWATESPDELKQRLIAQSLWEQLKADNFVYGDYERQVIGTLPEGTRAEMLQKGYFDVTRADGSTEHWRLEYNANGTVKDVVHATDVKGHELPALGVAPNLVEKDMPESTYNVHERWSNHGIVDDSKHLSPEEYATASAYFESRGMHAYKPGEKIQMTKLVAELHKIYSGITEEDARQFILSNGNRFEGPGGKIYEIWMGPKGPEIHLGPDSARGTVPRFDVFSAGPEQWRSPSGDKLELK